MKSRLVVPFLLLSLLGSTVGAWAQQGRPRDLGPDDRRQMRQQMRDHWQQERELLRRDEAPRRWQEVPPEDRRQIREDLREQRNEQDVRDARLRRGRFRE